MHTFGAPFGAQRSKCLSRFCAHKTCAIVFLRVAVHHYLAFRSFLILLCCDTVKRLFLLFFGSSLAYYQCREIWFLIPWQWLWGTFQKVLNIYHFAQLELIFSGSIVSSDMLLMKVSLVLQILEHRPWLAAILLVIEKTTNTIIPFCVSR